MCVETNIMDVGSSLSTTTTSTTTTTTTTNDGIDGTEETMIGSDANINKQSSKPELQVQEILDVNFLNNGKRLYHVQWTTTWESEEDLMLLCKDTLHAFWQQQAQHVVCSDSVFDNVDSPLQFDETPAAGDGDELQETTDLHEDQAAESSPLSEEEDICKRKGNKRCRETKITDIPDQYKNVGFAKSVRDVFGKLVPSDNNFDFVEHFMAEKMGEMGQQHAGKRGRKQMDAEKDISTVNTCSVCRQSFTHADTLSEHRLTCSGEGNSSWTCAICLLKCVSASELRDHMNVHNNFQPPQHFCFFCKRTYKSKNHLRRHIKLKHGHTLSDMDTGQLTLPQDCMSRNLSAIATGSAIPLTLAKRDVTNSAMGTMGEILSTPLILTDAVFFPDSSVPVIPKGDVNQNFLTIPANAIHELQREDTYFNYTDFSDCLGI